MLKVHPACRWLLASVLFVALAACVEKPSVDGASANTGSAGNEPAKEQKLTAAKPPPVKSLLGQPEKGVTGLIGRPDLKRPETAAQIWRYRREDCRFYVFLFRVAKTDDFQVRHVEAQRGGKIAEADDRITQACFEILWRHQHGGRPTS